MELLVAGPVDELVADVVVVVLVVLALVAVVDEALVVELGVDWVVLVAVVATASVVFATGSAVAV